MFERYTEKSRRAVFFSRYEASQFGSPLIETEHLLLGLFREAKSIFVHLLTVEQLAEIRREIELRTVIREKVSTSVDLPLSNESKRALSYAAEEAERAGHRHIGTEHLLAGLVREKGCLAETLLTARGVTLEKVRQQIRASEPDRALGAGGGMMSRRGPTIEFVCGEETVASGRAFGLPPHIGEHVIFTHQGTPKRYRVVDVCHRYEQPVETILPPGAPVPPSLPAVVPPNITVQLEEE